jgi:co-chaperonin GroES (HSP10)
MKAILTKILVEKIEEENKTASGIILTEDTNKISKGTVKSVGADVVEISVGDVVFFPKGMEAVKVQDLIPIDQNAILGIL